MLALLIHNLRKHFRVLLILLIIIAISYSARVNWLPFLITNTTQTKKEVIVTTDKALYSRGEDINIIATNKLNMPIFYAQEVECGASFWTLETCTGREIPYHQTCIWETYQHRFTQLNPREVLIEKWNTTVFDANYQLTNAKPGCYRISFPYTLKEKQPIAESWGNDKLVSYSNSFFIK